MSRLYFRLLVLLNAPGQTWRYFRVHGVTATMVRIFDALVRGAQHGSVVAANRWLDNGRGDAPAPIDTAGLGRRSVALIGALDLAQCKKYRVVQKVEQLEQLGCAAVISSYQDVPRAFDALQLATAVIFYRVPDGELYQAYLAEARRLGLPVCYDIDDPIFSLRIYKDNANLKTLSLAERRHLLGDSRHYLKAMQQADCCIVSTPGMLEAASAFVDGPVYLWRNALDAESLAIHREISAGLAARPVDRPVRIGYMSGSRAHDGDFELIAPALAEALSRHPQAELVLAGHAEVPAALEACADRIRRRPFSSYHAYYRNLAELDILVIPLLPGAFNACKSAIRYLEAALFGKPCVISAVGDFLNVVEHGRTGFLADGPADWSTHLHELIESETLRRQIGAQATASVTQSQSTRHIGAALEPALVQLFGGAAHA